MSISIDQWIGRRRKYVPSRVRDPKPAQVQQWQWHPPAAVRSAAAAHAGKASGMPQAEREGLTAAELCGRTGHDEREG